ncbi:uncharacterized protein TRAVEDRAFT_159993 [Trametes versicolor FP-101664 SS1]|uniref:uncharacterized protein n=1 Tax=Trametes versicolor (strain FP-101664) TaxID=717944 RepID=UPI0004623DA8|nr:uncharacterized protein TRAVEDRAFT_159993 [Trametes versicolor FP-101664 SS1]EIW65167.1 hypothetical protein TRAVEDRAFT_159993 [Trametes versicolor FP-101664 SS1]
MAEASSSATSSSGSASERYYALKGLPYSHLDTLELSPEVEDYLDILTDIADALGIDDLSFSTYSKAIERLDEEELSVTRSLLRTREAEDELTRHLLSLIHEQTQLEKWTHVLQSDPGADDNVPALERQKAALTSKAKEYQKELEAVMSDMPEAPPINITELYAFRKNLKEQEKILKEKRAKVEAFQGLPPNIDLARHALAEARDKQMELIQLRERLLGKMADGVN